MIETRIKRKIEKHLAEALQCARAGELTDYRWDRTHMIHVHIEDAEELAKEHKMDIESRVQEITDIAYTKAFPTSLKRAKKVAWKGDLEMVHKWKWAIGRYAKVLDREFPDKIYKAIQKRGYQIALNNLQTVINSGMLRTEGLNEEISRKFRKDITNLKIASIELGIGELEIATLEKDKIKQLRQYTKSKERKLLTKARNYAESGKVSELGKTLEEFESTHNYNSYNFGALYKRKMIERVEKKLDQTCYKVCKNSPGWREIQKRMREAQDWQVAAEREDIETISGKWWKDQLIRRAIEEEEESKRLRRYYGL